MQFTAILPAVQPLVPSIERQRDVDELQAHVGVKLRLPEDDDINGDADDRRRPRPDVLPRAEVNADESDRRGRGFSPAHRSAA